MPKKYPKIKGFVESSLCDWDGKTSAVIFLGGCNFRCPNCQNHRLVLKPEEQPTLDLKKIGAYLQEHSEWVDGVVITGGEPMMDGSLPNLVDSFREMGFGVKVDTNGSFPAALKRLLPKLDYVAMDVKAPLEKYEEAAGVKVDTKKIRQSIELLLGSETDCEFRTTVIPKFHTLQDLKKIGELIAGCSRYVLQQFSASDTLDPKFMEEAPYSPEELEKFAQALSSDGIPTKVRNA